MSKLTAYTILIIILWLISLLGYAFIWYKTRKVEKFSVIAESKIPQDIIKSYFLAYADIQQIKHKNINEYQRQLRKWQLDANKIKIQYKQDLALIVEKKYQAEHQP